MKDTKYKIGDRIYIVHEITTKGNYSITFSKIIKIKIEINKKNEQIIKYVTADNTIKEKDVFKNIQQAEKYAIAKIAAERLNSQDKDEEGKDEEGEDEEGEDEEEDDED
jgi:Ran GTPase-activating protein (RanGAP) involved in mRNA processing and transport